MIIAVKRTGQIKRRDAPVPLRIKISSELIKHQKKFARHHVILKVHMVEEIKRFSILSSKNRGYHLPWLTGVGLGIFMVRKLDIPTP